MLQANISQQFSANAKLMITGEYLVLYGALALAIPLKFNQLLEVSEHEGKPSLHWKTYIKGKPWFDVVFSLDDFVIANTNDFPTALNLRSMLLAAKSLNSDFLGNPHKYEAYSELNFDISWGLGSSSSLIANVSKWANVDPFSLFAKVSEGSGYDLATALSDSPILFRRKETEILSEKCNFYPEFHNNLYFAYLGKKRSSTEAVSKFKELNHSNLDKSIQSLNSITSSIIQTTELREFQKLIKEHEKIISEVLGIPSIAKKELRDFDGEIKSLGAWGGDFILLATDKPSDYVVSWLNKKDLKIWFRYEDIALKSSNLKNHY